MTVHMYNVYNVVHIRESIFSVQFALEIDGWMMRNVVSEAKRENLQNA